MCNNVCGEEATVEVDPESETYKVTKKILDVLYATADGFEVPEEGVEGFCNWNLLYFYIFRRRTRWILIVILYDPQPDSNMYNPSFLVNLPHNILSKTLSSFISTKI